MRTKLAFVFAIALALASTFSVQAVKPEGNLAGAVNVDWNLSADVAPVPPYGSRDIPGSDTASKLIVNQPNGNNEVVITGVMKDLHSNTTYTVYMSKGYTPKSSWPGLFTQTIPPFTFVTDEYGTASWHLNLTDMNKHI
mgnify:CR=1 FL=1